MTILDPNKVLSPELRFTSTATYLYRIGLNLKINTNEKRKFLHFPIVLFVVLSIQIVRCYLYINLDDSKDELLSYRMGNIGHFLKMNFHYNMGSMLFYSLAIYSVIVYYFNYSKGVEPTFLRLFDMIAGVVPPISIEVTDEKQILQLIRRTRLLFSMFVQIVDISVFIFGTILHFTPYLLNCTFKDIIVYGIPNNVVTLFALYFSAQVNLFQVLCFYLISYYIKAKIRSTHGIAAKMIKTRNFSDVRPVLTSLNLIYNEVNDYNQTYWSKFMFGFWMSIGAQTIFFLFGAIFMEMSVLQRGIMYYIVCIIGSMFLFVIFTASSVNVEANKSYKLLNRLNMAYVMERKNSRKLKRHMYKLRTFIEISGRKTVGFSCWNLFIVDNFRCYEVLSSLALFFLKVYEM